MKSLISEEVKKRKLLSQMIAALIKAHIVSTGNPRFTRSKRRPVQKFIANKLNLVLNNVMCNLINEQMDKAGFTPIINYGEYYYRGCSLKATTRSQSRSLE